RSRAKQSSASKGRAAGSVGLRLRQVATVQSSGAKSTERSCREARTGVGAGGGGVTGAAGTAAGFGAAGLGFGGAAAVGATVAAFAPDVTSRYPFLTFSATSLSWDLRASSSEANSLVCSWPAVP